MSATTVSYPTVCLSTARPWWQREWLAALAAVRRWSQRSRERAALRELEGLSEHTCATSAWPSACQHARPPWA